MTLGHRILHVTMFFTAYGRDCPLCPRRSSPHFPYVCDTTPGFRHCENRYTRRQLCPREGQPDTATVEEALAAPSFGERRKS